MTVSEEKQAQRKAGRAARKALSPEVRAAANAALCANLWQLDAVQKARTILLYAAFGAEADLAAFAEEALRRGKVLAYPVCGEGYSLTAAVPGPDGWETGLYGIRTPVPERESIRSLAAHQATMVLFLSTSLTEHLQAELLAGGYAAETPVAVVYKATWPEEKIFRCTVGTLHETVTGNGLTKTSLIVVGNCLGDNYLRSLLYHPDFTTEFRKGAQ